MLVSPLGDCGRRTPENRAGSKPESCLGYGESPSLSQHGLAANGLLGLLNGHEFDLPTGQITPDKNSILIFNTPDGVGRAQEFKIDRIWVFPFIGLLRTGSGAGLGCKITWDVIRIPAFRALGVLLEEVNVDVLAFMPLFRQFVSHRQGDLEIGWL